MDIQYFTLHESIFTAIKYARAKHNYPYKEILKGFLCSSPCVSMWQPSWQKFKKLTPEEWVLLNRYSICNAIYDKKYTPPHCFFLQYCLVYCSMCMYLFIALYLSLGDYNIGSDNSKQQTSRIRFLLSYFRSTNKCFYSMFGQETKSRKAIVNNNLTNKVKPINDNNNNEQRTTRI